MLSRSPWSELFGSGESPHIREFGERSKCSDFELNAKECLEAYGAVRGARYCKDFLEDWYECGYQWKQMRRHYLIRNERFKKYMKGELKSDGYWAEEPHRQSYIQGPFTL